MKFVEICPCLLINLRYFRTFDSFECRQKVNFVFPPFAVLHLLCFVCNCSSDSRFLGCSYFRHQGFLLCVVFCLKYEYLESAYFFSEISMKLRIGKYRIFASTKYGLSNTLLFIIVLWCWNPLLLLSVICISFCTSVGISHLCKLDFAT